MNDRLSSRKNDTIKLPSTEQPIKYAKLLGVSCMTLASAMFPFNGVADLPSTTSPYRAEQADQQQAPPDLLQNMTVVALSTPNHPQYGQHDILSEMFTTATGLMSDTTQGYLQKPQQINVVSHTLAPDGVESNGDICYTGAQIDMLRNDARANADTSIDLQVPVVVYGDARTCGDRGAASALGGQTIFYPKRMGKNTQDDTSNFVRTVTHEMGHVMHLSHSRRLRLVGFDSLLSKSPVPESHTDDYWRKDIYKQLQYGTLTYKKIKNSKTHIDEYAGYASVMGDSDYTVNDGGEIYNFSEINTINPDLAPITQIDTTKPGEFVISLDATHNPRGIRFALPSDHPLQHMNDAEPIDSVAIGLNHEKAGDVNGTLAIIGNSPSGATTHVDTSPLEPGMMFSSSQQPTDEWASLLIYRDSSMGFSVFAKPYKGPGQDYNSIMTLEVRPDSAKDGALLAQ